MSRSSEDPVLATKREEYLAEGEELRKDLQQHFSDAVSKTKHVHANLLITTEMGYNILKNVCLHVGCVEASVNNISWRDLAFKLGFSDVQIKCFDKLEGEVYFPVEKLLQYFAATTEGSVGDVFQALSELGFQSALTEAHKYLHDFLAEIENSKDKIIDVQVQTNDGVKIMKKIKNFNIEVPIPFDLRKTTATVPSEKLIHLPQETFTKSVETDYVSLKSNVLVQRLEPQPKKSQKRYKKIVMLSFAKDGKITALKIAKTLREKKIGVMMLFENEQLLMSNPGKIISEMLSQVDFVIPILTEGYFNALKTPDLHTSLLDERFVLLIHTIMVNHYSQKECMNSYVRSIIPKLQIHNILGKQEFMFDPILYAWKSDDRLDSLIDNILQRKFKTTTNIV